MGGEQSGAAAKDHDYVEKLSAQGEREGGKLLGWGVLKEGLFCLSVCSSAGHSIVLVVDKYKSHRRKLKECGVGETTEGQSGRRPGSGK